jgi:hypothetical protein
MDKILYGIENFKNMQELIRFVDQKAGALLVVYGFVLTIFAERINTLTFGLPKENNKTIISVLIFIIGATIILLLVTQLYYILVKILKPRLAKNYTSDESCLYYFEHVAAKDKSEIVSRFIDMDDNKMLTDISGQIYEVSKVLNTKMDMLGIAIKYALSIIILLIIFTLVVKIV